MASNRIRLALGAAAMLSLVVSTTAVADSVVADGDSVTAGTQTSIDLGAVAQGDSRAVDVAFVLTCQAGASELPRGTQVFIDEWLSSVPADGSMTVSSGEIAVPSPCADGQTVDSTTPAHLVLTAPTVIGVHQEFDVLFAPRTGAVTNMIAISVFMDVVAAAPADTTPPVLHGVPDSMTVNTTGDSAVVSWPAPTATDDTDPSPTVGCAPASGSTFPLGTTTVTCTATDASGNSASASFDVTVVDPPAPLVSHWGRPLHDSTPALIGRVGRTVPLKLELEAGSVPQGPKQIAAPVLTVTPLTACTDGTPAGADLAAGTFQWSNHAWRLQLRTASLGVGCWQLEASVDGTNVAVAVIRLARGHVAASLHKH